METIVYRRLVQHLKSLGVCNRESARFAKLVDTWVSKSGPVWAVKRLKRLDAAFKAQLGSKTSWADPGRLIPAEGWAMKRSTRRRLRYADPLVQRMMHNTTSRKAVRVAQSFFRMHGIVKLDRCTESQFRDWYDGVVTPPPYGDDYSRILEEFTDFVMTKWEVPKVPDNPVPYTPLAYMAQSWVKRSPVVDSYTEKVSTDFRSNTETLTLEPFALSREWTELIGEPETADLMHEALTGRRLNWSLFHYPDQNDTFPAGTIAFIQENGAKLRAVANPFLCIQGIGLPLQARLGQLCQELDGVEVFTDESHKRDSVVEWLQGGSRVWSYDSSKWTDRFPYDVQRVVLLRLLQLGWVTEHELAMCDILARQEWVLPSYTREWVDTKVVKFGAGQPMGWVVSFFLATVTHSAVASMCCHRHRLNQGYHHSIVGDDISWSSRRGAASYASFMNTVGVSINMDKSMVSDQFAEFCSKILTVDGPVRSMKVKIIESFPQLLKTLDFYGERGLFELHGREAEWAIAMILPTEVGGYCWSPPGATWSERISLLKPGQIQRAIIRKELIEVLNPATPDSIQSALTQASKAFALWDIGLSDIEKLSRYPSEGAQVSRFTGFPVNGGMAAAEQPPVHDQRMMLPSFFELVDQANRDVLIRRVPRVFEPGDDALGKKPTGTVCLDHHNVISKLKHVPMCEVQRYLHPISRDLVSSEMGSKPSTSTYPTGVTHDQRESEDRKHEREYQRYLRRGSKRKFRQAVRGRIAERKGPKNGPKSSSKKSG